MITHNVLYSRSSIVVKAGQCAAFIDDLATKNDIVVCPVMQSGYQFASDVSKQLASNPPLDFYGVTRYANDGTEDDVYLYKGANQDIIKNKTVIIVDTLCSTGVTIDLVSRLSKQLGAKSVYTACLLCRQYSSHKPNWCGWQISDEIVYGYGLDHKTKYRTLPYIAYE